MQRFERVRVVGELLHSPELRDRTGTVLWCDRVRPGASPTTRALYLVVFAPENAYRTLFESSLRPEGGFDTESAHLGTGPEFSFDIVMSDDMNYIEGTYRLPGRFWEVMIFRKDDVPALRHRPNQPPFEWPSGVTGTVFLVPRAAKLDREYVRSALGAAFGVGEWVEVAGPDSMVLR